MVDLPKLTLTSPHGFDYRVPIDEEHSLVDVQGSDAVLGWLQSFPPVTDSGPFQTTLFGGETALPTSPYLGPEDYEDDLTAPATPSPWEDTVFEHYQLPVPFDRGKESGDAHYNHSLNVSGRSEEPNSTLTTEVFDSEVYNGHINTSNGLELTTAHSGLSTVELSVFRSVSHSSNSYFSQSNFPHATPSLFTANTNYSQSFQSPSLETPYQPEFSPLRTEFSATERLSSPTTPWSALSSPSSPPSSAAESPSIYTPSLNFQSAPLFSYLDRFSTSPTLGVDKALSRYPSLEGDGGSSSPSRGPQRIQGPTHAARRRILNKASRSSSASRSARILDYDDCNSPETKPSTLAQSRIAALTRRAYSGFQSNDHNDNMFAAPMLPRGRGRVVSDSYLTVPPTHDDSGTKARMWLIAQDTPTFDEDDPPPKEQVASDAVVNSAIGRRSRKADFSCTFPGCKATFTAKHNLHNHLNSHYRIRNFKCAQCERDFGTAHVLQRHRRVCKGTKRIRIPTPGGN